MTGCARHGALSIMVPTWRPRLDYLESAISSVLSQFDADQPLQVELVDDCSPDFDVAAFARRFGAGRVSAHRNDRRLGLAGNWNACISRSKNPWVHLLHQDDFVLKGFYQAITNGMDAPIQLLPRTRQAFLWMRQTISWSHALLH